MNNGCVPLNLPSTRVSFALISADIHNVAPWLSSRALVTGHVGRSPPNRHKCIVWDPEGVMVDDVGSNFVFASHAVLPFLRRSEPFGSAAAFSRLSVCTLLREIALGDFRGKSEFGQVPFQGLPLLICDRKTALQPLTHVGCEILEPRVPVPIGEVPELAGSG